MKDVELAAGNRDRPYRIEQVGMYRRVLVAGAVIAAVAAASCTLAAPHPPPTQVLSPVPRSCAFGPIRASRIPASSLAERMAGHMPSWLPPGMGLVEAFGPGAGSVAGAYWADAGCREIEMYLFRGSDSNFGSGPRVGAWTVTADAANACYNPVLGSGRCLTYHARVSDGILDVEMMGIERPEGDRIIRSIPT